MTQPKQPILTSNEWTNIALMLLAIGDDYDSFELDTRFSISPEDLKSLVQKVETLRDQAKSQERARQKGMER